MNFLASFYYYSKSIYYYLKRHQPPQISPSTAWIFLHVSILKIHFQMSKFVRVESIISLNQSMDCQGKMLENAVLRGFFCSKSTILKSMVFLLKIHFSTFEPCRKRLANWPVKSFVFYFFSFMTTTHGFVLNFIRYASQSVHRIFYCS